MAEENTEGSNENIVDNSSEPQMKRNLVRKIYEFLKILMLH